MVLALTTTLNSVGVGRSNGKEAHNGGRPTCFSCFFPSGAQEGFGVAGPGRGRDGECCVRSELFGL